MKISVFYDHMKEAAKQENLPLESICEKAASFGISAAEIENTCLRDEKNELFSALKHGNMEISCMYGFFDFAHQSESEAVKAGMDMVHMAAGNGIKKIMPIPGFLRRNEFLPFIYKQRVRQMTEIMGKICDYAKDNGIMVVLEDFDGKEAPFAAIRQLAYFMDTVDNLYCAFDTGNFLYSEEDVLDALPVFADKIGHVHCKDRSFVRKEGQTPKTTVKGRDMYSCAVGSGVIPMKEIINTIADKGYDDYFTIEHFGSMNQLKDMEQSAVWIRENYKP